MTDGSEYGDDDEDDEDEYEDDGGPRAAFITRGRRREDLIVSKASETARRKENITNRDKLKNLFEAMRTDRVARASLENGGGKVGEVDTLYLFSCYQGRLYPHE